MSSVSSVSSLRPCSLSGGSRKWYRRKPKQTASSGELGCCGITLPLVFGTMEETVASTLSTHIASISDITNSLSLHTHTLYAKRYINEMNKLWQNMKRNSIMYFWYMNSVGNDNLHALSLIFNWNIARDHWWQFFNLPKLFYRDGAMGGELLKEKITKLISSIFFLPNLAGNSSTKFRMSTKQQSVTRSSPPKFTPKKKCFSRNLSIQQTKKFIPLELGKKKKIIPSF